MKKILVVVAAAGLFFGALEASAQTRSDSFNAAAVEIDEIVLRPLADGGCEARWCGGVSSEDGGVRVATCTDDVSLKATVNVNRCAGLASAGANRVSRALRFEVDAGAP